MTTLKFRNFIRSTDDQLGEEAVEWLMRYAQVEPEPEDPYSDPAVRDDAFLNWTARSSNHLRMFIKTIDMYQRLGQINPEKLIDMNELLAGARGEIQRLDAPVETVPPQKHKYFADLAAAVVLAVVGALFVRDQVAPAPTSYATRIGERQTITLPDQSIIVLNTSSHIAVSFDTRQRRVHLISGEALFEIRHDASRPFAVMTADATIEDIGTEFDVYRHAKGATVSVIEGRVRLNCRCKTRGEPPSTPASAPRTQDPRPSSHVIAAGEQGEILKGAEGSVLQTHQLTATQLQAAIAWRTGVLELSGMTLAEAVAQLNRYTTQQLVIADPSIADLPLGGTLLLDVDSFLATLKGTFRVEAMPPDPLHPDPNVIRLRRQSPSPSNPTR